MPQFDLARDKHSITAELENEDGMFELYNTSLTYSYVMSYVIVKKYL